MTKNISKPTNFLPIDFAVNEHQSISLEFALEVLKSGTFEEKWVIAKRLVKAGEIVINPLKEIILDESANQESRWYGLKILSQIKNPQIILIVTELLTITTDEDLIILATQTLANQGKESIKFLSELLVHTEYRLPATKALAQIPSLDIIEPLLSVVNDDNVTIRTIAISVLGNFDTPEINRVMIQALSDYSASVRKEALTALGLQLKSNPDVQLISLISPLLSDINLSVAQQAANALSRCHHPLAVDTLYRVLTSSLTPVPLQMTIVKALAWIATPQSIQCLGKAMEMVNLTVIVEIIAVLGRLKQPDLKSQAVAILTTFYYSQSPILNQSAILQTLCYSLRQLSCNESSAILNTIATNHNLQVSIYAMSALEKINVGVN